MSDTARIIRITGPVVEADRMRGAQMYEVVYVGDDELIGEIIGLEEDLATIQVYEETGGITPGEPVQRTGMSLSVELGPGLLGMIYDGIQRPLTELGSISGDFIIRGVSSPALPREETYRFTPDVAEGDDLKGGAVIGTVPETNRIIHSILLPPHLSGRVAKVAPEGEYTVLDPVLWLTDRDGNDHEITMLQRWPVRVPRPVNEKLPPVRPLITGQRVIDSFFPMVQGGTASVPGPFGAGKTVVQHQLAKWSDADIVVYVGCGERGNEMADVLRQFPALIDPKTKEPLMKRTVLIGNTSNMPVAAREASVYTGITIAEYYRDMGYSVALMADSTSRWAEAMREISGRLEEMPGEHGYPAYLGSRLADFYERAGRVTALSGEEGSVSVIGAVSPPGGDFSEPVTQNTLRIVRVFWALDADLAHQRHFPAVNWLLSYSLYADLAEPWWEKHGGAEWGRMRSDLIRLLQKESELEEIVQLVGPDLLPEQDKFTLHVATILRESFLIQSAFDEVDTFCPPEKQYRMMRLIHRYLVRGRDAVEEGMTAEEAAKIPVTGRLARMGPRPHDEFAEDYETILDEIDDAFGGGGR
ncbi:V/A-type H+-transporting ATPase subunit A [Methanocalculus alkaliphilus]|uniref:V-type ATP synthase subunit A n=1 Tax=Methanocalculus alkaliphilus TaxID=768730 RepID=UPI002646F640|nr:V-type ATP synthase subunit A [Methanocalculus alkaliphilus]MCP1715920.1 V/A-type H+-transporting ATPase subunit A [Methanocalculus alkaliphilus]